MFVPAGGFESAQVTFVESAGIDFIQVFRSSMQHQLLKVFTDKLTGVTFLSQAVHILTCQTFLLMLKQIL